MGPNLLRMLRFAGWTMNETLIAHAVKRWQPIHKPDTAGWPNYLLRYTVETLPEIAQAFKDAMAEAVVDGPSHGKHKKAPLAGIYTKGKHHIGDLPKDKKKKNGKQK